MRDMKITPDQQIAAMYAIECLPEPKSQDEACATADAWKLHEAIQEHRGNIQPKGDEDASEAS